jgi:hypothetical protein
VPTIEMNVNSIHAHTGGACSYIGGNALPQQGHKGSFLHGVFGFVLN